ncbi:MAG: 3-hydroxyacyl-CoA dehydrogenase NAD-binding domain-containing protein, partial [Flavitalea sp.]
MSNPILKICVCGAGTMGTGIAQVFASNGFSVILYDLDDNILETSKNKIGERNIEVVKKIQFTTLLNHCIADIIIEAIIENATIKGSLFNDLSKINKPSVIFVTNTSSLSVTEIAGHLSRREQFAGMHFFNPAP